MAKKTKTEEEQAEVLGVTEETAGDTPAATEAPAQQAEEFLPPPDPPVNPSLPQEPATGYEVDHQVKHADPEEETHVRELDLVIEGVRGEGPRPEEPAPPPEEG